MPRDTSILSKAERVRVSEVEAAIAAPPQNSRPAIRRLTNSRMIFVLGWIPCRSIIKKRARLKKLGNPRPNKDALVNPVTGMVKTAIPRDANRAAPSRSRQTRRPATRYSPPGSNPPVIAPLANDARALPPAAAGRQRDRD